MKIVGLMPVRNESWILGLSARAALLWCDDLVIALHACSDESSQIAYQVAIETGRVLTQRFEGEWNEMEHRQVLLDHARAMDASHIAIIDADEILTGALLPSIRGIVESLPVGSILQPSIFTIRETPCAPDRLQFHASGLWANRVASLAFRDDARLGWRGETFHHREPFGMSLKPWKPREEGGIIHFWGASERRHRAKHALYKCVERLKFPHKRITEIDQYYNQGVYGVKVPNVARPVPETFRAVPPEWLAPYAHLIQHLHLDAEPWQEAEVRRLIAEHGSGKFAGLDLFGVAGPP